jgi:hypothetical protein
MSNYTAVLGIIEVPNWPGWHDALRVNESALSLFPDRKAGQVRFRPFHPPLSASQQVS